MVRRLVEEERVRRRCEDLREEDAELEAAGQRRKRIPVDLGREAESLQDRRTRMRLSFSMRDESTTPLALPGQAEEVWIRKRVELAK